MTPSDLTDREMLIAHQAAEVAIHQVASKFAEQAQVIDDRLNKGSERMDRIEKALNNNNADTSEVLEILRGAKAFFKVTGWVGSFIKWLVPIAAGLAAIWATLHGGNPK
jgi:hypothetical protein